jgi:AAA domain
VSDLAPTPEELAAFHSRNGRGEPPEPFTIYSADDLAHLPPPSYLVADYVIARGHSVLYGGPGAYKSFLALAWSLSIASGIDWCDHAVEPGAVLYIAAEGFSGLLRRVDAWCEENEQPRPPRIHFLPEVVNFLDAHDMERAHVTIDSMPEPPVLIVRDTVARTMPGGEENSAKDVGRFIAEGAKLAQHSQGGLLDLHHVTVEGNRERGSSALRGAADAMHLLKIDGADRLLEVTKMKDAEPTRPLRLGAAQVADSLVLRRESNRTGLGPHERQILDSLSRIHGQAETSTTRLQVTCEEEYGLSAASFYRARTVLVEGDYVRIVQEGRNVYNALSKAGRDALLSTTSNHSHESRPTTLTHPPGFRPGSDSGRGRGSDSDGSTETAL